MNIWLVQTGEPLPLEAGVRKMRTALVADKLAARGHRVSWWTSAFEHQRKVMVYPDDREVHLSPGLTLQVMRGCGYSSNVSLARYVDHLLIARKFRQRAWRSEPPDVIVASLPCHQLAFEAVRYGRGRKIPVLVDIRDLWPDIFLTKFQNPLIRKLGQLALFWDFGRLHRLLRDADGVLAVSKGYLQWALEKAGRPARKADRVFLLGYRPYLDASGSSHPPPWPEWLRGHEGEKLLLFIGTFGVSYELQLLVEAARRLQSAGRRDVCLVLAGTGEQAEDIRRASAGLANVVLPGWLEAPEISALLGHGYLGLAPYRCARCEEDRMPNKPFEYLSAGLPLISSLEGEMAELISSQALGLNYHPGDLDGLYAAIEFFLDHQDLRGQMSTNASNFYKEYGNADKIYDDYARHVESLAQAGKR